MDIARKAVYLALRDVEDNKAYSNLAVQNAINKLGVDRVPFVRELFYGVIRNKLFFDYIIGKFIKTPVAKLPVPDRILLCMGLHQLCLMDSVPDYAGVSETVELAKKYARGREAFINGVLRSYLRDKECIALPERDKDEIRYLSVKYSFAPWIIEMWMRDLESAQRVENLLGSLNRKPELCVRVNTLKIEPEALKTLLEQGGFTVEADEDFSDLFFITDGAGLLDTDMFKAGLLSVQDKSSRIAAEALGAKPGDTVVDVCAAPGGKTMAIAAAMKNTGKISAVDVHKRKVDIINGEAARLGVKIVTAIDMDSSVVCGELVDSADSVLCDVPCSGLGTAHKKPEVKYKEYNGDMERLPQLQLDILKASSRYVKHGGTLVYSTCTIAKRENQDVAEAFLRTNKEYKMVDMVQLMPVTGKTCGFFICKMARGEGNLGG